MGDLAPHIPGLVAALGLFALGFVVIGPNIAAIMATSMAHGRKRGLAMALGVGLGSGLWATATVTGLATLITAYAGAVVVLKLFGVAFLLWLAVKALRSAATPAARVTTQPAPKGSAFWTGWVIQMTNPKAALHWIAIASVAMNEGAPWTIAALLVGTATALSIVGHGAYALVFSTETVTRAYAHARRWIDGCLGGLFTVFAYRLATERG